MISPFGVFMEFKGRKAADIRSYLDPRHALDAAGISD